jgi:uncharacterized protein (TIGR02611 family)
MTKAEPAPEPSPDDRSGSRDGGATGSRGARPHRERGRLYQRLHSNPVLGLTTKIVVTSLGLLVLAGGVVMMVTPGPGIVGIILGLGILATEYDRAHDLLVKAREKAHEARVKAENMDPRIRRRRLLLGGLSVLVVVAALAAYVAFYDWPSFAVDGWDWLQGLAGWVPELPGM